jgi:hypothetical protein
MHKSRDIVVKRNKIRDIESKNFDSLYDLNVRRNFGSLDDYPNGNSMLLLESNMKDIILLLEFISSQVLNDNKPLD